MTATAWEVTEVSHLAEVVQRLADCRVKSPAMVVHAPDDGYEDRSGGARNRFRISRYVWLRRWVAWLGATVLFAVAHIVMCGHGRRHPLRPGGRAGHDPQVAGSRVGTLPQSGQQLSPEPKGGCGDGAGVG
jgi:hypothetical protein